MKEQDDFDRLVMEPLRMQERQIGDDIDEYRICGICLNYTPRASYDEHMAAHGYTIINIQPDCEEK